MVVDLGSLGGVSTGCADEHSTGLVALKAAGFSPTADDGFVKRIAGKPSKPDINKAYWSYWRATKLSDGRYSAWSYATLGPAGYRPKPGDSEGWHYVLLSDPRTPPRVAPSGADPRSGAASAQPTANASPPSTPSPSSSAESAEPAGSSGSPVGAIVVAAILVAAAGGLAGRRILKGRRR